MNKVEQAQHRANITAFLSNHPGEHTTEQVAKFMQQGARTIGQMLGAMARGGLIGYNGKTGKSKRWFWEGNAPTATEATPTPTKAPKRGNAPKEIELSIEGWNLVLGTNPATGRLRIVLDQT